MLLDLGQRLVVQQVGNAHLLVAHVVAEPQVGRDVHARRLLAVEAAGVDVVRLPAVVVVLLGRAGLRHRHPEERKDLREDQRRHGGRTAAPLWPGRHG